MVKKYKRVTEVGKNIMIMQYHVLVLGPSKW